LNILLTGSTGFLGNVLMTTLIKDNNVVSLARHNSQFNIDLSKSIPNFQTFFDTIIHSAGLAHSFPISNDDISGYYKVNVIGTNNLLEGLSKSLPKRFVYISSVSVYGLLEGENINENSPLLAKDPYGKSKIEAEEIIKKWCCKHDIVCTILRLPLVIGPNPPGNLGSMLQGIKKGYYFNIAGGNAKKSMVLASDIAKYILIASEIGGTYNLTDGKHPTFNELSMRISKKLGKSFVPSLPRFLANVLAFIGDRFGNQFPINSNKLLKITSTLTFDDTKARNVFEWSPIPVLEDLIL
jgi:nucleoside-diphosphate-sugar epimerase